MGLFATLRHITRLTLVEHGLRDVAAKVEALDREWSDVSAELNAKLAKIAKRAKKIDEANERSAETAAAPLASVPTGLTPAQLDAHRQIMARRRASGGE